MNDITKSHPSISTKQGEPCPIFEQREKILYRENEWHMLKVSTYSTKTNSFLKEACYSIKRRSSVGTVLLDIPESELIPHQGWAGTETNSY
jgi:hypothetical protein